jgi:hypothetical protein
VNSREQSSSSLLDIGKAHFADTTLPSSHHHQKQETFARLRRRMRYSSVLHYFAITDTRRVSVTNQK